MTIDGIEFKQEAVIVHSIDDFPQVAQIDVTMQWQLVQWFWDAELKLSTLHYFYMCLPSMQEIPQSMYIWTCM